MFSATAALDGSETADLMEQIQQLNQRLDDQQALFEARLQTQEERYERLLAINERAMVRTRGADLSWCWSDDHRSLLWCRGDVDAFLFVVVAGILMLVCHY